MRFLAPGGARYDYSERSEETQKKKKYQLKK